MKRNSFVICFAIILYSVSWSSYGQNPLLPDELLALKSCRVLDLSPDGTEVLYSISTPRGPNDAPGGAITSYWRMNIKSAIAQPLFNEGESGYSPAWLPDGQGIAFISRKSAGPPQVWKMNHDNSDWTQLTFSDFAVASFKLNPNGKGLVFMSRTLDTDREKILQERGYGFIFYEENLKNNNLYVVDFDEQGIQYDLRQLTHGVNVWDYQFNGQGSQLAASISPKNLIDHRYMFRKIHVIDIGSGKSRIVSKNEGKLGNYAFSPNGKKLAYTAAININDHQVSQVYVVDLFSGLVKNLTPRAFAGHVSWASWKDDQTILYMSGEGVYPKLSLVQATGGTRKILLDAADSGVIFTTPQIADSFDQFVFVGSSPEDPGNIYAWDGKSELIQLTDINPILYDKDLGTQEIFSYKARDGVDIEGLLMYPVGYDHQETYPLILYIHGGPESHHSNSWLSRYATPGQVMAGKGYLVAYLNYRASTGYGVDFAMEGFMDPAGKEFDDIADAIDYLIKEKGANRERVGLAGGSYGGYASAWFATYYTKYVKAVCMFVGISDVVSKRLTTDIPWEEYYVHSGKPLEEQWQMGLERSPIYYAHQSKTATLIYGGTNDTRVHPSQSLELYRLMKMNDHPAVRLVQYPGEGHGNRKQVGQIDVLYRQIGWLDWYVRDLKPLDGPLPPLDISDQYGLTF